jgi:hypothetical protein
MWRELFLLVDCMCFYDKHVYSFKVLYAEPRAVPNEINF